MKTTLLTKGGCYYFVPYHPVHDYLITFFGWRVKVYANEKAAIKAGDRYITKWNREHEAAQ